MLPIQEEQTDPRPDRWIPLDSMMQTVVGGLSICRQRMHSKEMDRTRNTAAAAHSPARRW
jgi:hypothetical protein